MTQQPTPTSLEETPVVDPTVVPQPEPATPSPEPAPQPKPEETVEYWKDRYGKSTSEAQLLIEQNKLKDAQIEQLTKPHDPTDAELKAAYPEWDEMLPTEKRLARENFSLKKGLGATQQTIAEHAAEIRWNKDLKTLLKDPQFAALKGREDEFEEYVFKPTHKGIPLKTLGASFLFGAQPAPQAPPAPTPASTGERGRGGPAPAPKKKLTAAEGRTLRETNFEEYRRQNAAGNIDFDDID